MARKGGLRRIGQSLAQVNARLRALPARVAQEVTREVAPKITAQLRADYDAGRTAYGQARPAGKDGQALDLVETGAVRAGLAFAAEGTRLSCPLPTDYTKYLIGKYQILPISRSVLPASWSRIIHEATAKAIDKAVKAA